MSLTFAKRGKFVFAPTMPAIEPQLPPLMQQARNFGDAFVRSVKSVAKGNPLKVSDATKAKRQEICRSNACGKYRASDDRCSMCGCPLSKRGFITAKTELFAEFCKLNFWRAGEMASGELKP